jgi:hypothetical protein
MASAVSQPVTEVGEQSPQRGSEAQPLVRGRSEKSLTRGLSVSCKKLKAFKPCVVQRGKTCIVSAFL